MLILKPFERCPYAYKCPYTNKSNQLCRGDDKNRNTEFKCNYYQNDGTILTNKYRNPLDYTGTSQILHG